jgi:hypothetical protein
MAEMEEELVRAQREYSMTCRSCGYHGLCRCPLICLVEHYADDKPVLEEISRFYQPRTLDQAINASPSNPGSTRGNSPRPAFEVNDEEPVPARLAERHPIYGLGRRREPSLIEVPDDTALPLPESSDSSVCTVPDDSNEVFAELAGLADEGHAQIPSRSSSPDFGGIEEALCEEIDPSSFIPGHLTRAYLREDNFDPLVAAKEDLGYQEPAARTIQGFSKIPSGIYPFNGNLEGHPFGVPPQYAVDEAGGFVANDSVPALYSSSIQRPVGGRPASLDDLKRRYTRVNADGTRCTPRGTLFRILRDQLKGEKVQEPAGVEEMTLYEPLGKRVYDLCREQLHSESPDSPLELRTQLALKVRSMIMDEPTDVPPEARRNWLHRLVDVDNHGCTPIEVALLFSGHLSLSSQAWQEFSIPSGQRFLRALVPGKDAGTFTMSTGSARWNADRYPWAMKIGARFMVLFLCGGGYRKTRSAFRQSRYKSENLAELRRAQEENPPLVPDNTEGAVDGSKTIDPSFSAEDFFGRWEEIKEPGKESYFQQ